MADLYKVQSYDRAWEMLISRDTHAYLGVVHPIITLIKCGFLIGSHLLYHADYLSEVTYFALLVWMETN